jgi:hypothetical protein
VAVPKFLNMITVKNVSYGRWEMTTTYYRQQIGFQTTDSRLVDDIKDGKKSAIKRARKQIVQANKLWWSC